MSKKWSNLTRKKISRRKRLAAKNSSPTQGTVKMLSKIWKRPEVEPYKPIEDIDPLLVKLLTKCTPHGHEHHIVKIIKEYITEHTIEEINGNVLIKVGENSTSLFSCHMDIIGQVSKNNEDKGGVDSIVLMTPKDQKKYPSGYIYGAKYFIDTEGKFIKYGPCPLGADDKVGVYIMMKMILHNIPGLYVFHVGEELGGVGSKYLTKEHADRFKTYKRAIAFDRADYGDIIEFQRYGRCCSNTFGKALAAALNVNMPNYQRYKDAVTGSFTDTAEYRDLIPECCNISVGYFNQHGVDEYLDYIWLKHMLLPAILKIDFEALPVERDPTVKTTPTYYRSSGNVTSYNMVYKTWVEADQGTKDWDLPKWEPKMGWVEHNDDVLYRAIIRYVGQNMHTAKEREKLGEFVFELLEKYEYAEIEIDMHKDMIHRLQQQLRNKSLQANPDIIIKREFLVDLLSIGDLYSLPQHDVMYRRYCKGATAFLQRTEGWTALEQYTDKDIRKLNRTIFMMAYYLSISELINNDVEKVLKNIHEYVTLHITEEGFNHAASIQKEKVVEQPIIVPFDTGRSQAVH